MAEGGDTSFCSREQTHGRGCEYFADGGSVGDFDSLTEDAPSSAPSFDDMKADPGSEPVQNFDDLKPDPQPENTGDENLELSPEDLQKKMFDKAYPNGTSAYETPAQQALGAVEGVAHGLTLGASDIAENKLLGVPAEDIEGRASENPWEHGAAEIVGSTLGIGKVAKMAEAAKIGSALIRQGIVNGMIQGGDEVSRLALGQGDPHDGAGAAIAHTALATIVGSIFGKLGSGAQKTADKMLTSAAEKKFGEMGHYFLYGVANAMKGGGSTEALEGLPKAALNGYKAGQKFFSNNITRLLPSTLGAVSQGLYGAKEGYDEDGIAGGLEGGIRGAGKGALYGLAATLSGLGLKKGSEKYLAPTILKVLNNTSIVGKAIPGIAGAVDHVANMAAGYNATNKAVEGAFNLGVRSAQKAASSYGDPKIRKKIDDYLEENSMGEELQDHSMPEAPGYAKGGHVEAPAEDPDHGLATHYPEQNMIMKAAKGRMVGYLNSLRPAKLHTKLAFDDDPDTTAQKKRYEKALDIAGTPLGIMEEVADGTLDPDSVAHFNALHPEVAGLLHKKIAERVTKSQVEGKKPPFHVRQSLSLLTGTNLTGELTPQNIQAAQATFSAAKQQRQPDGAQGGKKKPGSASSLSNSDRSFLTDDQARSRRQQKV